MAQPAGPVTRSERTRSAILAAAEDLFAERGFAATRLEDIAERVGIKRASIVYYFKDKRELYEAVLSSVLGGLHQALNAELSRHEVLGMRIEAAMPNLVSEAGFDPTTRKPIDPLKEELLRIVRQLLETRGTPA